MSNSNDRASNLKKYFDPKLARMLEGKTPAEKMDIINPYIRKMSPDEIKKYAAMYPELIVQPKEKSVVELQREAVHKLAQQKQRVAGESEIRIALRESLPLHNEWIPKASMNAKQRIASTNGELPMTKSEYENRKAQLSKLSVDFTDALQLEELWEEVVTDLNEQTTERMKTKSAVEPEPVEEFHTTLNLPLKLKYVRPDIFDQKESLKRYVASHITTRDMEPTVNTVYFRIDKTLVVLSQLLPLSHIQHPFDDYTLSYPSLEQGGQFDFVRVSKTNNGYKLHSFSIDIYGTYRFHGQAMLADFYADTNNFMFNIPKSKLTYSNRVSTMKYDPYFTPLEIKKANDKMIQAYARLRQFLTDFVLYDREEVTVTKRLTSMKHKPRDVQYKHIEYTLDMSKTKRVKYEEQQARIVEEERRQREEHEEMLRREHDRIAHKRRLADGRVIKVRGTTVCKGSPLGKVTKVYKS